MAERTWEPALSGAPWSPLAAFRALFTGRRPRTDGCSAPTPAAVAFETRVEAEVSRARRDGTNVALLLADVDRLKDVNRTHGDDVGDQLLRIATAAVAAACGPSDMSARYSGDELVLLAPGATANALVMRARQI